MYDSYIGFILWIKDYILPGYSLQTLAPLSSLWLQLPTTCNNHHHFSVVGVLDCLWIMTSLWSVLTLIQCSFPWLQHMFMVSLCLTTKSPVLSSARCIWHVESSTIFTITWDRLRPALHHIIASAHGCDLKTQLDGKYGLSVMKIFIWSFFLFQIIERFINRNWISWKYKLYLNFNLPFLLCFAFVHWRFYTIPLEIIFHFVKANWCLMCETVNLNIILTFDFLLSFSSLCQYVFVAKWFIDLWNSYDHLRPSKIT